MATRWLIRVMSCAALLAITACAGASGPARATRPDEVQVVEPAGKPDAWSYAPQEIAVARGTTVTFVNRGKEFHTVTADAPGRPFDLSIDTNQSGTITFNDAGVFAYHCGVHPQMKGTVRVCDGACG